MILPSAPIMDRLPKDIIREIPRLMKPTILRHEWPTITARELNVASIFADEALMGAITAANIDVSSLFAAEAFIAQLNAVDIS